MNNLGYMEVYIEYIRQGFVVRIYNAAVKVICLMLVMFVVSGCSFVSGISDALIDMDVDFPKSESSDNSDVGQIFFKPIERKNVSISDSGIKYINNEILIVAKNGTDYSDIEEVCDRYGTEIVGYIEKTGDYQILLDNEYSEKEIETLIENLKDEDYIQSVMFNYVVEVDEDIVNYGNRWANDLKDFNDCSGLSWGVEAIRAPEAWDLLEKNINNVNTNLNIGIIDSQFDLEHEDLGFAETFPNYNSSYKEKDSGSHGTHVAGTMAAVADNEIGICGVYPYGRGNLYPMSSNGIMSYSENGTYDTSAMFLKIAFAELILRDVKVINVSLNNRRDRVNQIEFQEEGWEAALSELDVNAEVLGDFLNRLVDKGYDFVIVSAAGNSSSDDTGHLEAAYNSFLNRIDRVKYPKVYGRIIVVGSVGKTYEASSFSNVGERTDIFAPGEQIYSTIASNDYGNKFKEDNQEISWSGTSMASPHVSGVAAMVWAADRTLTGEQVKFIICNSVSDKSDSINIIDAKIAVMFALHLNDEQVSDNEVVSNGSIMSYVVKDNTQEERINGADVIAKNLQTNEIYTSLSDKEGHFELIVPDGEYSIKIEVNDDVDGYGVYEYQDIIKVTSKGVVYLDWAKISFDSWKKGKTESELISYIENQSGMSTDKYVYLDMDKDGKNEMIAFFGEDRYDSYDDLTWTTLDSVWFCNSDCTNCEKIFESTMSDEVYDLFGATDFEPNSGISTSKTNNGFSFIIENEKYNHVVMHYATGDPHTAYNHYSIIFALIGDKIKMVQNGSTIFISEGKICTFSHGLDPILGYAVNVQEQIRNCYKIICTFRLVFHDSYCVEKTCRAPARLHFFAL